MKKNLYITMICLAGLALMMACGGGNNSKSGKTSENEGTEQSVSPDQTPAEEAVTNAEPEEFTEPAVEPEQKVEPKKWYENDFSLTEKMYIMGSEVGVTRTFARKGNIIVAATEGSTIMNVFVCTDSTRTNYLVNSELNSYGMLGEKKGFKSVDEAVYKYLSGQMSETVFGKTFTKDDPDCVVRDTTIFGRPAYIITKEATEKNMVAEVYGKTILYVDKEYNFPYYKYNYLKSNDQVMTDGKSFELVDFSFEPTYEGLVVSLEGLTEAK